MYKRPTSRSPRPNSRSAGPRRAPGSTSWQPVSKWYNSAVGEDGHYYHKHVVIPKTLHLLQFTKVAKLLDLACGQGVLARSIDPSIEYVGVDIAGDLIQSAKKLSKSDRHQFTVGDVSKQLQIRTTGFTHATIILALQNIEHPERVFQNVAKHLIQNGKLVIVLNHPHFRIPRQTSWGIDERKKLQYRRVEHYLSPLKIPITAHPGKQQSPVTWSFHRSLQDYSKMLKDSGFVIELIEEWVSDKKSEGPAAKMENRSREEFPLFMAIVARKR